MLREEQRFSSACSREAAISAVSCSWCHAGPGQAAATTEDTVVSFLFWEFEDLLWPEVQLSLVKWKRNTMLRRVRNLFFQTLLLFIAAASLDLCNSACKASLSIWRILHNAVLLWWWWGLLRVTHGLTLEEPIVFCVSKEDRSRCFPPLLVNKATKHDAQLTVNNC